jgi:hypothetical protein
MEKYYDYNNLNKIVLDGFKKDGRVAPIQDRKNSLPYYC